MRLSELRKYLRENQGLPTNAEYLGVGSFREAYKVGMFVVKEDQGTSAHTDRGFSEATADIKALGLRRAPTVRVGTWVIQPYYQPITNTVHETRWYTSRPYRNKGMWDLHAKNIGLDRRGRYVAFDW